MNTLIQHADNTDHSTGKKRWARMCERHQLDEIAELEKKHIEMRDSEK